MWRSFLASFAFLRGYTLVLDAFWAVPFIWKRGLDADTNNMELHKKSYH